MDGGSTDATLAIVAKYEAKIDRVVSKKDKGQYFAIQDGFSFANGDVYCWLNADDILMPWTLSTINILFKQFKQLKWLIGKSAFINKHGLIKRIYSDVSAKPVKAIRNGWYCKQGYGYLMQESMFWSRELWEQTGGLNCDYSLAADYNLWIQFSKFANLYSIDIPLAAFRKHEGSRSVYLANEYEQEVNQIRKGLKQLPLLFRLFGYNRYMNLILRVLIKKKSYVITQPMSIDEWRILYVKSPLSGIGLRALLLERNAEK